MSKPRKSASKTTNITSKAAPTPPPPFSPAPKALEPFLNTLAKNHVYITHIDKMPWRFKRKIFIVPIAMNIVTLALLFWRVYAILPFYAKIALSIGANQINETTINTKSTPWNVLRNEVLRRFLIFFFDFTLYNFVWPWPKHFFIGKPGNPTSWRLNVGFKDKEIIIRQSRKWDREIFAVEKESSKLVENLDTMMEERVMSAIDPTWLRSRTGYVLMDANWDLDFKGMVDATELVQQKKATFSDFEKAVIVWGGVEFGWLSWDVHKLDEGGKEESRKKLITFKVSLRPTYHFTL